MPRPFPAEFRRDVIAVARKGEASISQVARDFGISESCLQRWLKIADREDGLTPAASGDRGGGSLQVAGQPVSQRDWDDAHLINAAYDIHHDDPAFGYRFIADELRQRGLPAGENPVARLCSQQRIWSIVAA